MNLIRKCIPLACLSVTLLQAQEKKGYTNFADTTFNLQEVVATAHYKALVRKLPNWMSL